MGSTGIDMDYCDTWIKSAILLFLFLFERGDELWILIVLRYVCSDCYGRDIGEVIKTVFFFLMKFFNIVMHNYELLLIIIFFFFAGWSDNIVLITMNYIEEIQFSIYFFIPCLVDLLSK